MYTNEDKNKVRSLSVKGLSLRKISDLTGIPKSTVSDWVQEEIGPSNTVQTILLPDTKSSGSTFNGFPDESNDVSDRNRTDIGQINLKNETTMNEPDEDRTEMFHERVSPEMLELKKLEIQLFHERELKKLEIESDSLQLRKQEMSLKERELNYEAEKISRLGDEFREKIIEVARCINDKGQNSGWDYDEIMELSDKIDHVRINLLPIIEINDIYLKKSVLIRFIYWIMRECPKWLEDVDMEEGLGIEFTDGEVELVEEVVDLL